MSNTKSSPSLDWFRNLEPDGFEDLKLEFAVAIERALIASGKNRIELASAVGVSPARITKVLCGDSNLTMQVMHKLADALGQKIHLKLAAKGQEMHWFAPAQGQQFVNIPQSPIGPKGELVQPAANLANFYSIAA